MTNVIGIAPLQSPEFAGDITTDGNLILGSETTAETVSIEIHSNGSSNTDVELRMAGGTTGSDHTGDLSLLCGSFSIVSGTVDFSAATTLKGPTPVTTDSSTNVATTAFVQANKSQKTVDVVAATEDNQTAFTVNDYSTSKIDVFLNGLYLVSGTDYTTNTDNTTITLDAGTALSVATGDNLVVCYLSAFSIADAITESTMNSAISTAIANISNKEVDIKATTDGQSTFTVPGGYTAGYINVYLNGVRLINTIDYTATTGTTVVLNTLNAASVSTGDYMIVDIKPGPSSS